MNEGQRMYDFAARIFPYNRSITGAGVRQTLADIAEQIRDTGVELKLTEVPSGTQVFDWTVPKEWVIREAYIEDEAGNHIIDMREHNLHILGYSAPVDEWVDLTELRKHVYVEEGQPDVIPYVTSYYKERYGFCMSKKQLDSLPEGRYHMYVDSEFIDGSLTYAEAVIPGDTEEEILFSTYFCHPSMADNECSGPALSTELIRYVAALPKRRYTYRFVFNPETIGAITYLSQEDHVAHFKKNLLAGYVLSCVGDNKEYSLIASRYGHTLADKTLKRILADKPGYKYYPFTMRGSDERQYNAPGVELPVVAFCRSKYGTFPEYHTSDDNMTFVSPEGFQGAYDVMTEVIRRHESARIFRTTVLCEPQLGKRGLYSDLSRKGIYDSILVQRDIISYSDGSNDLDALADIIGASTDYIMEIMQPLLDAGLIEEL